MISFLHASTTASSSSAMLEQARRSTHNTSRHDSHDTLYLSCRDVTQQVEIWDIVIALARECACFGSGCQQ